jgi:hypothetical protein
VVGAAAAGAFAVAGAAAGAVVAGAGAGWQPVTASAATTNMLMSTAIHFDFTIFLPE